MGGRSELELDFTEEEEGNVASYEAKIEGEGLEDYLRQVIESPLWVLVRDFLTSADVFELRTTGVKWNTARLCGSFAELWFFFLKKEANDKSEPLSEWLDIRLQTDIRV